VTENRNPDPLFTTEAAAEYLDVSVNTLLAWRQQGRGPRWVRVGDRLVKYRRSDLEAYIAVKPSRAPS
jgi:excisionase family DNA binding protein